MSGRIARITYKQDQPGRTAPYPGSPYRPFGAFVMSPRMQGLVLRVTRDVKAFAEGISPTSDTEGEGPRYKDSFVVAPGRPLKIDGLNRVTALLGNTAPHAPAVEFGSGESSVGDTSGESRPQGGYNKPQRVLGRAGRAFGDFSE